MIINKFKIQIFCVSLIAILLMGCVPNIPMSPQDRQLVHKIKIDPNVDMPNGMYFSGDGSQLAGGFGIIGAVISQDITDKDTRGIMNEEHANKIDFSNMLVSELNRQVAASGLFKVVNTNEDATMQLKVLTYGFQSTGLGFSNKVAPVVAVTGQLVRDKKVIWSATAGVDSYHDNIPSHTMDEIRNNPNYLRDMWETSITITVKKILKTLADNKQ